MMGDLQCTNRFFLNLSYMPVNLFNGHVRDGRCFMTSKRMLKKMGYKKREVISMDVKDIIKLGEMGYSKNEIEAMQQEVKESESVGSLKAQISDLESQLKDLRDGIESDAIRETATEQISESDIVQDGLNILAGGLNG